MCYVPYGMARKDDPGPDVIRTSFVLPSDLLAQFKRATAARDTTMSREVRHMIRSYVAEEEKAA
jgi:metal-responsive CopG/Arc/MetJ family transcriptional regulator